MYKAWRLIRSVAAAMGLMLLFIGVSTSDYYIIEQGVPEPDHVLPLILIGLAMMIPAVISRVKKIK